MLFRSPYYWANQQDAWHGSTNRDNTLRRWAVSLQNDFRARLDWCVKPPAAANHPPRVMLNDVPGTSVVHLHARPGDVVRLSAAGSSDPDGQPLDYEWFTYPEAGMYRGHVKLGSPSPDIAQVPIPPDAGGGSIHVVLAATDRGSPPLTRYRRAVIGVSDSASAHRIIEPFLEPPAGLHGQSDARPSPLRTASGGMITSAAAWAGRRAEILKEWHDLMGPWPSLLDRPQVGVLSESRRDNFIQRRVRLPMAPGQTGDGWLLEPLGTGPFPAVLVVYYEPETSVGLNPQQPQRDFALQLARRGFVTLAIGTPGGNAWKPDVGVAKIGRAHV